MTEITASGARLDELVRHPDEAITAYTYFMPTEPVLRALVEGLFGAQLRERFLGAAMPADLEAAALVPLPAVGEP